MIYLALLVLAFSVFIIYKEKGDTRLFLFTLTLGWIFAVLCFLIYLQYLERRELYVSLFAKVLYGNRLLPELPVPSTSGTAVIIALMNLGIVLFIYSALSFALSFSFPLNRNIRLYFVLLIPPIIEFLIYSPWLYEIVFLKFFAVSGTDSDIQRFFRIEELVYAITSSINYVYLIFGLGFMVYTFFRTPKMKYFRNYYYFIFSGYLTIMLLFAIILWWAPKRLISVTSAAGSIHILPVSVLIEGKMLKAFPYAATISFATLLVSLYRFNHSYFNLRNLRSIIVRSFDISDSGIRFFTHMVKNYAMASLIDAEALKNKLEPECPAGPYADRIISHSNDLLRTLNGIQSKLAVSSINLKLADVRTAMDEALGLVDLDGIELDYRVEQPSPKAFYDPDHLKETFANLLLNAVHAMVNSNKLLHIEIKRNKHWVDISIADTGCGIPESDVHKAFIPFYTTKDRRSNWGLGLPYAYRIVMAHQGKLYLESEPGVGTTLKILLPLIE